jgi:hypothetical protein
MGCGEKGAEKAKKAAKRRKGSERRFLKRHSMSSDEDVPERTARKRETV